MQLTCHSWQQICLWFIFAVVIFSGFGAFRVESSFASYEQPIYINTTALTVSTLIYNPSSHYSKWVTRLLGQEAIFHNRSYFERKGHPLSAQEKRERSQIFNNYFRLSSEAILPSCSFEFTGFVAVDHAHPLSHRFMMTTPSIGLATLHFLNADGSDNNNSELWKCYYRGTYETANKRLQVLPAIHWPVFGYCPAPRADSSCLALLSSYRRALKSKLVGHHSLMRDLLAEPVTKPQSNYDPEAILINHKYRQQAQQSPHTTEISSSPDNNIRRRLDSKLLAAAGVGVATIPVRLDMHLMKHESWSVNMDIDLMNIVRKAKPSNHHRAVCAVLPYAAADPMRRKVNEALAFEFIRYYSHLGFKVALYDRDGRHFEGIFHSAYSALHHHAMSNTSTRTTDSSNSSSTSNMMDINTITRLHNLDLLYYNHTMLQLLWPDSPFPQEEVAAAGDKGKLSRVIIMGDSDKRLTYTHCRANLQHKYGIEQVLIVDIDEFIYCPKASGSTLAQRSYLDSYIEHMNSVGVEQLVLKQRVNVAKAGDMATCLVNIIQQAEQLKQAGIAAVEEREEVSLSLFACVAAFRFVVKHFFDKSLHLSTACPMTSFHHSSFLRFFDCYANSYISASRVKRNFSLGGCSVVHLSTKVGQFNRSHPHDMEEVKRIPSELITIAAGR